MIAYRIEIQNITSTTVGKLRGSSFSVGHGGNGLRFIILTVLASLILNVATSRNENNDELFYCLKQFLNADCRKNLKLQQGYKRITPPQVVIDRNQAFFRSFILLIYILMAQLWLYCLLINCGDIETIPGPWTDTDTSSSSLSTNSYSTLSLPYDTQLSICHHNIQSLLPKIDLLQYEIQPFDVFIFSETWLNNDINSNELKIINFKDPFRCDRDIRAGGVAIYVKENIACKRRSDLEINNPECVWIELKICGRLILVVGIY